MRASRAAPLRPPHRRSAAAPAATAAAAASASAAASTSRSAAADHQLVATQLARAHPAPFRCDRRLGGPGRLRGARRDAGRGPRRRRGPAGRGPVSGLPWGVGPHYQGPLTPIFSLRTNDLSISSAFDGGNIRAVAIEGDVIDLEIVKDHESDFYQWFYFRLTGGGGRALRLRIVNCARRRLSRRLARIIGPACQPGPRGLDAGRDRLCGRRADDQPDAGLGQRLDRLFRALHDGAASRSGRLGRRRARRRISLARPDARRPGDRLFPPARRPAAGLALRPPASRRDHGRMVDGGRARETARRSRSGDPAAAPEGDLPRRAQHESGRVASAAICGPTPPA